MNTPGLTLSPGQGGDGSYAAMQCAPPAYSLVPEFTYLDMRAPVRGLGTHTLPLGSNSGASLFNLPSYAKAMEDTPGFSLALQGLRIPALFSEGI